MLSRIYLRASDASQDANRARAEVERFAKEHGLLVAGAYMENETGTKLDRPELTRLLDDSRPGDLILVEQVDRLSRLSEADWKRLRGVIEAKGLRVVAMDLPTSWMQAKTEGDEFTSRMFAAINAMMLDMLAAIARKDWADRKRRQAQGIAKLKAAGGYKGRPEDTKRNALIASMLRKQMTWTEVQEATGCGRATVAKIAARLRAIEAAA